MKRFLFLFVALLTGFGAFAQFTESFESGLPTNYNAVTDYFLSSGTWTGTANQVLQGSVGVTNGSHSLQLRSRTGSQVTTPALTGGVGVISFDVQASTASGAMQVLVSEDGVNFTQVSGSPISFGTNSSPQDFPVNNANATHVRFYRTGATVYIDNVFITSHGVTTPGITINPTAVAVNEDGATANFTVVLDSEPAADVIIDVASSDVTEGTVSTSTLSFTPINWATPQTVTVTGVDDSDVDGTENYTINLSSFSLDTDYDRFSGSVNASTSDNDAMNNHILFQMINPCGVDGPNEFIVLTVTQDTDLRDIAFGSVNDASDNTWNFFWNTDNSSVLDTDLKASTLEGVSSSYDFLRPSVPADKTAIDEALAELNAATGTNTDVFVNPTTDFIPAGSTVILFLGGGIKGGELAGTVTGYFDDAVNYLPFDDPTYNQAFIYPVFGTGSGFGYFSHSNPRTQYLSVNGSISSVTYTPDNSSNPLPEFITSDGQSATTTNGTCMPPLTTLGVPLPVELTSFTARKANDDVVLNWETASELNNDRFEVEFSTDGENFIQIGTVAGNGTTAATTAYDFTHTTPVAGVNYYRLKQVDFDGTYEYSNVVKVNFDAASNQVYVRPTVTTGKVELVTEKSFNADAQVFVVDVTGKTVMTATLAAKATVLNLDATTLANGHYFVKVAGTNEAFTTRFIKK